jgi:hypothetical protein
MSRIPAARHHDLPMSNLFAQTEAQALGRETRT